MCAVTNPRTSQQKLQHAAQKKTEEWKDSGCVRESWSVEVWTEKEVERQKYHQEGGWEKPAKSLGYGTRLVNDEVMRTKSKYDEVMLGSFIFYSLIVYLFYLRHKPVNYCCSHVKSLLKLSDELSIETSAFWRQDCWLWSLMCYGWLDPQALRESLCHLVNEIFTKNTQKICTVYRSNSFEIEIEM